MIPGDNNMISMIHLIDTRVFVKFFSDKLYTIMLVSPAAKCQNGHCFFCQCF